MKLVQTVALRAPRRIKSYAKGPKTQNTKISIYMTYRKKIVIKGKRILLVEELIAVITALTPH